MPRAGIAVSSRKQSGGGEVKLTGLQRGWRVSRRARPVGSQEADLPQMGGAPAPMQGTASFSRNKVCPALVSDQPMDVPNSVRPTLS